MRFELNKPSTIFLTYVAMVIIFLFMGVFNNVPVLYEVFTFFASVAYIIAVFFTYNFFRKIANNAENTILSNFFIFGPVSWFISYFLYKILFLLMISGMTGIFIGPFFMGSYIYDKYIVI